MERGTLNKMTEKEIETIDQCIEAYENMIKYYKKQIALLNLKKTEKCCFEEKIIFRLKVK